MKKNSKLIALAAACCCVLSLSALHGGLPGLSAPEAGQTGAEPPRRAAAELPFFEDFSTAESLDGWTQINNNSQIKWIWNQYDQNANLSQRNVRDESGCDNWLISPGFSFQPGITYQVSFDLKNWFDSDMHVYLVTSTTDPENGKKLLMDYVGQEWGAKKAEFEVPAAGTYFIAFHDVTPYRNNGTALRYELYIDNFRLEMLSNNAVPEAAGDLRQVPGKNGEVSMGLEWTNPSLSKQGEKLNVLRDVKIYKDGTLAATIDTGVKPGVKMSWTDPAPTAGEHTYSVVISNTTGDSDAATVKTFVGIDMAGAPENLSVDYDSEAGIITLDWEQPQFGVRGGWYDPAGIRYRVVRQPGHKILAAGQKELVYEDEDLQEYGNYVYQITTITDAGTGGTAESKGILVGASATLPLREGWEDKTTYSAWTVADNNGDGKTFYISSSYGNNSAAAIGSRMIDVNLEWDESIYSPPVRLEKGKKYRASYDVRSNPYAGFSLNISYGKDKTRKDQKVNIATYTDVVADPYSTDELDFTAQESGTFYFSWWIHDATNYIWFDNFRIEEVFDSNIEATAVRNSNTAPSPGDELITGVTYKNTGTGRTSSFKVQLIDASDNVLGEQTVSRPLAAGASGTANIKWTVPSVLGQMSIRGRVVMAGDKCEADNTTLPETLTVQNPGLRAITIGTSTDASAEIPFHYYGNLYSESIYRGEDFGNIAGTIKSLSFKVRFGQAQDFIDVPVRLYLCNTDKNDLFSGWIPSNMMTKVFEGKVNLNRGAYELNIPFDKGFQYAGGNLCVLLIGDYNFDMMINNGYGMMSLVSEYGLGSTRALPGGFALPAGSEPSQEYGNFYSSVPNAIFYIDHTNTTSISGTVRDADGNPLEGVTVSGSGYNDKNLKTVSDKEGKYTLPYFPAGYAAIKGSMKEYADGNANGFIKAGEPATMDLTLKKLEKIQVNGTVTSATDGKTPVVGAEIHIAGDNEFTTTTDAEGKYVIDGVYAYKAYPVVTIVAEGYQTVNYGGTQFRGTADNPYVMNVSMKPFTAAPYSVTAVDKGETAEITWTAPIDNITATKSADASIGKLGGAQDMRVGHRYSVEEMKQLEVNGDYYVQSISFVPVARSKFSIAVWQGETGNEALVYKQEVNPSTFSAWSEFELSEPYKVDPTKSLIVGYMVEPLSGAYPIGFDAGPAVEGGDCMFNPDANAWTSAHELLPGQMNYNWSIRATFGNYRNTAAIPWLPTDAPSKVARLGDIISIEDVAGMAKAEKPASAGLSGLGIEMLDAPVAQAPVASAPASSLVKGYNVYRVNPGQENGYTSQWTKLNSEPVTGLSYIDETWKDAEQKPYRFAVTSFYGNRYAWGDGVTSKATFSDGVDKGRYSTLTVNVSPDYGNAEGAEISLLGDGKSVTKTVEAGKKSVVFENVRFADYTLIVLKPFFENSISQVKVDARESTADVALRFASPAPADFEAVDYIKEARLAWEAPTSAVTAELTVGNPNFGSAYQLGVGQEFITGQRSTPEMRKNYTYDDFYIDAISFYANAALTYSPLVWEGNKLDQQFELVRMDYTVSDYEVGSWITVKLDEPIKINPESTYYYGYGATSTSDTAPFAIDEGPADVNNNGSLFYMLNQKTWKYEWTPSTASGNVMVSMHITDTPDPEQLVKQDVKFDIYRLAAADADDESKWTKVTAQPLEGETYTDAAWKSLADADWQYAVKAVFYGDVASKAALSKVMGKGKVSLVNADITVNNGRSAEGAMFTILKGSKVLHHAEVNAAGHVEIPEVAKGKGYTVRITLPGYEDISERLDVTEAESNLSYELKEVKAAPGFVEVFPTADNKSVDVQWRKPGAYAPQEGWTYWDNNNPYGGFGTSTGFCAVAQLYTPEDQEAKGMKELDITKISFFPTQSSSNPVSQSSRWVAKVWRINADMSVDEVATGDASGVVLNKWNEVEFDTPYRVTGEETLLVGYEFHGQGNALGIDNGPLVPTHGDWANFGQGWQTLSSVQAGFNYNNLIHTFCQNLYYKTGEKAPALAEAQSVIETPAKAEISFSRADRAAKSAEHPRLTAVEYPVKGYLVYRLPVADKGNEANWTLLTQEPVSETTLKDTDWSNLGGSGVYTWAVKAVYASGNSEPAFCNYGIDGNGRVSEVDEIAVDGISVKRIADGRFMITVPAEATLNVADTAGIALLSAQLAAGENVVEVDSATGVCLFRISCEGKTRTFKFML